jgi:Holliday junction resolvasome RuvABC endonuclease subunit
MSESTSNNHILGLRAEPTALHWAIVEGTRSEPILKAHDRAVAPASYGEPAALAWIRSRVLHLIDTYRPDAVGVRFQESFGPGGNKASARQRSRVEGVVLEASHSRGLKVLTGTLSTIGAKLGTKHAKKYVDEAELRGLDLSKLPRQAREAVLIAVAQLPEND